MRRLVLALGAIAAAVAVRIAWEWLAWEVGQRMLGGRQQLRPAHRRALDEVIA